ncbi:MAG TPA: Hsp20/alpha crystallin family protein [Chloroflexi bacterium]|jgi:HSP20 family protein|nr:Hsp20/alpha crystallin family protein [Chloroflexota bacterium]
MAPGRIVSSSNRTPQQRGIDISRISGSYDLYLVRPRRIWRPPTDVYETDEQFVVKVEIAGADQDDIEISLIDRRLVISGRRQDPASKLIYHNMEISYGEFRTEVRLDRALNEEAVEATYENGFLFVTLPKAREYRVPISVPHSERQEES